MVKKEEAISELMGSIAKLLESCFFECNLDAEKATSECESILKDELAKFGFNIEFVEND